MNNKLILGTAQLGLTYGINNRQGTPSIQKACSILKAALDCNITHFDTAQTYGDSEKKLGIFSQTTTTKLNIISKLPSVEVSKIKETVCESLEKLATKCLYGYLIHNFETFRNNPQIWNELTVLKQQKMITKIGFSLYYPEELEMLFRHNIDFDLLQIPFNVFDQRFSQYFSILKSKNVEIHIRSCFLQGLVFKEVNALPSKLAKLKTKLQSLHNLAKKHHLAIAHICLGFVALQPIDKIVLGVDEESNIKENVQYQKHLTTIKTILPALYSLKENDEQLILPLNW